MKKNAVLLLMLLLMLSLTIPCHSEQKENFCGHSTLLQTIPPEDGEIFTVAFCGIKLEKPEENQLLAFLVNKTNNPIQLGILERIITTARKLESASYALHYVILYEEENTP